MARTVNEQTRGLHRCLNHKDGAREILKRVRRRLWTVEWNAYLADERVTVVCSAIEIVQTCMTKLAGELKA